jgi:Ca2+-binding EF-hand superfamily protein
MKFARQLFIAWDMDGEGSLSEDELVFAFVKMGLSEDHHFAKKIMHAIKVDTSNESEKDFSITLGDFISIFSGGDAYKRVLEKLNEEVLNDRNIKQTSIVP